MQKPTKRATPPKTEMRMIHTFARLSVGGGDAGMKLISSSGVLEIFGFAVEGRANVALNAVAFVSGPVALLMAAKTAGSAPHVVPI
jgi:hypothetical protein